MKRFPFILNILGLTVAFAAFSVILMQVQYDLKYDRHYQNADRLYRIEGAFDPGQPDSYSSFISRPMGQQFFDNVPEVELGGVLQDQGNVFMQQAGTGLSPVILRLGFITPPLLDIFEVKLIEGDLTAFAQPRAMMLSRKAAAQLFPGENPIGKMVCNPDSPSETYTIVGLFEDAPKNSSFLFTAVYNMGDHSMDNSTEWSYHHYLRVSPNAQIDSIESRVTRLLNEYTDDREEEGATNHRTIRLTNLHQIYFNSDTVYDFVDKGSLTTTYSLITIAFLLIAIAIINFVNFSLAAVPMRIRSINTRKILGSSNAALRGQQLLRAVLTALAAWILAMGGVYLLSTSAFTTYISADMDLMYNLPLLGLCLVIALVTGFLAGLYPAFYSTSFTPALVLKGSFSLSPKGRRLRSGLIGFQYVISFVLIMVALYINVQSSFMKKHDLGFRKDQVVTLKIRAQAASQANLDAMESALRQSTDVVDVTFADGPLVSNGKMGWGRDVNGKYVKFDCLPVAPNFVDFFGLEVLEGRGFIDSDRLKANGTIIFNQTAVETYPELAVGGKISGHVEEPADIVGMVNDFNFQPLQYRINPIALYVFGSAGWGTQSFMYIRIVPEHVPQTLQNIRNILAPFMPGTNMAEQEMMFVDQGIGALYVKEDRLGMLIMLFSFLSVFISLIGILGLIFFDTQFRRKEMAVRRVLGSSVKDILRMLNTTYLKLTVICFVISLPIAIWIMKTWVRHFPYQSPMVWWIFAVALVALSLITIAVITLQSYRTVNANPVDSLAKE